MVEYAKVAKEVRRDVLSLIHKGQTSHIASCFSSVDIATVLYSNLKEEDVVIWSKGWASALFYVMRMRQGHIDREELFNTFPQHPYLALLEPTIPGVYVPTGSVGHGLSVAAGIALGKKRANESGTVYCIMSDGELNEGSTWEAAMFAAHHKLDNLVAIIDKNGWQAMGKTEDVMNIDPYRAFQGFGWWPRGGDGHDHELIARCIEARERSTNEAPNIFIFETIKGKGVSFMEGHLLYHYKNLDDETYQKALAELV